MVEEEMSPHDFSLSMLTQQEVYVIQKWYCQGSVVVQHCPIILNIWSGCLNVEGQVQYQHLSGKSYQSSNSISMPSLQSLNSLKILSVIWYTVYMSWLHFCSFVTSGLIGSRVLKTMEKMCSIDVAENKPFLVVLVSLSQNHFSLCLVIF